MSSFPFLELAEELEIAGLLWQPEIGDEVSDRADKSLVSILVDPQGMSPAELRSSYLWLPSVEQMIFQFESRQAILFHAGLELNENSLCYKTVVQSSIGHFESEAQNLRTALGIALRDLLLSCNDKGVH